MRRNLTISFSDEFIAHMDRERGSQSRGAWLEGQTPGEHPVARTANGALKRASELPRAKLVQARPIVQKRK